MTMTRNRTILYWAFGVFCMALFVAYACGQAFAQGASAAAVFFLFLFAICLLFLVCLRRDYRGGS